MLRVAKVKGRNMRIWRTVENLRRINENGKERNTRNEPRCVRYRTRDRARNIPSTHHRPTQRSALFIHVIWSGIMQ